MTRTRNLLFGFVLLAVVAVAMYLIIARCSFFPSTCPPPPPPPTPTAPPTPAPISVTVYGGYRCFEDQECLAILRNRYRIEVTGEFRKGTYEMTDDYKPGVDCIWPGSLTGIDYFKTRQPGVQIRKSVIFQTPIILFTWEELLPELEQAGLVYLKDGVYYMHMQPLVDAMIAEELWSDIGVGIPGYVRVESTDPASSSSGMMWMEMIGSYLLPENDTGGKVLASADLQDDPMILPTLYTYWENQGRQVATTSNLFGRFISSGAGIPLVVAYESSFIDWYEGQQVEMQAQAKEKIVGLYPESTINTDHTLASLTPACDSLVSAMSTDTQIQKLLWEKHGFRNSAGGIGARPLSAPWLAASVPYVNEAKLDVYNTIKDLFK